MPKEMAIKMGTWEKQKQVKKEDTQKTQYGKILKRMKYAEAEMKRFGCYMTHTVRTSYEEGCSPP